MTAQSLFQSISVLVVDDSAYMRHLLLGLLHALEVGKVHLAANGEEGLELYQRHAPDVVITDAAMEPGNGFELVKTLRAIDSAELSTAPILMVSGHTDVGSVKRARDAGITAFISKPISAATLYTRLAEVVCSPRTFVETSTYRGPDRRRRDMSFDGVDRRQQHVTPQVALL